MGLFVAAVFLALGLSANALAEPGDSNKVRFESAETVEASEFLPRRLQSGKHHTVSSSAISDGFQITYTLNSKYGTFKAVGLIGVEQVVTEINAIAELEAAANETAFVAAIDAAGIETAMAITKAFTYPVISVKGPTDGIPRIFVGTGRGFGLNRRLLRGGGTTANELSPEAFRTLNHELSKTERAWAKALRIDPYTTNIKLRRVISALSAVEHNVEFKGDISTSGNSGTDKPLMSDPELYEHDTTELELSHRECLATLGVSGPAIEKFLSADYLTPTSQTVFCNILSQLTTEVDADELATAIANSPSFAATNFLLQMIGLMAWYQVESNEAQLSRITVSDGLPYGYIGDSAVLFLPVENLLWTRILANRVTALDADKGIVWVHGSMSKLARSELKRRGWQIKSTSSFELASD